MSTTQSFRFYKPFPFCPEAFDINSLDYSGIGPQVMFIRDLTLEDAMALFWNLENLVLQFNITGALTSAGTVACDFNAPVTGSTTEPFERVCISDTDAGPYFDGVGDEVNGESVFDGVTTTYRDMSIQMVFAADNIVFPVGTAVTVQDDGYYTLWFTSSRGAEYLDLGGGGTSGSGYDYINYASYIDAAVLSGTVRLRGLVWGTSWISGGTLNSATLTPNYYTY